MRTSFSRRFMLSASAVVASAALILGGASGAQAAPAPSIQNSAIVKAATWSSAASFKAQIFSATNYQRHIRGLRPIYGNTKLDYAANRWARELAAKSAFYHNPNLVAYSGGWGSGWRMLGENIARGQSTGYTVTDAWMASPGHRANILNPNFNRIGIGYAVSANGTPYYVQVFGQAGSGASATMATLYAFPK